MIDRLTEICDECDSAYLGGVSAMVNLCPECSHHLYGYPNCDHRFEDGRCLACGWDGSRSEFIARLIS